MLWEALPLGWCYITLYDSGTSVAASLFCLTLQHQTTSVAEEGNGLFSKNYSKSSSHEIRKKKAAGRTGVKYDSSQSVKTGYLGNCLFQFTWETWGILTSVRIGAANSQQHSDWPDLHLPTPTCAQASDFSFCNPHLLCILLPGSYLLLAQSQNIPLATWASSHALLQATQATTHGSLVSAWKTDEQALLCSAHTQPTCGVIPFSPNLNCYLIHLNLSCSF